MTTTNAGCCEKCEGVDVVSQEDNYVVTEYVCRNPTCPCHQQAGEGWEERFDELWETHDLSRAEVDRSVVADFIASEIATAREEGWHAGFATTDPIKCFEEGRAAMKEELLIAIQRDADGHDPRIDEIRALLSQ